MWSRRRDATRSMWIGLDFTTVLAPLIVAKCDYTGTVRQHEGLVQVQVEVRLYEKNINPEQVETISGVLFDGGDQQLVVAGDVQRYAVWVHHPLEVHVPAEWVDAVDWFRTWTAFGTIKHEQSAHSATADHHLRLHQLYVVERHGSHVVEHQWLSSCTVWLRVITLSQSHNTAWPQYSRGNVAPRRPLTGAG